MSYDPTAQANLELGYDAGPQMTYGGQFVDQEADLPLAKDPTGTPSWDFQFSGIGQLLKGLGLDTSSGSVLKSLGSLFTGTSNAGALGQLLGFGGLGALLNNLGKSSPQPVGYQGDIPQYTATRTQTPISQQRPVTYESLSAKPGEMAAAVMVPKPYRPGQGGITYFTPMQYAKTGRDLGAAPSAPSEPAAPSTPTEPGPSVGIPPLNTQTDTINVAQGGYMPGGIAMLAGGRYLRGPGDGVSDSIPAKFERSGQPARLADGEFVIDARTVSEIGNGSSEAGARKLYAMMDRVHKARKTAQRGKPSGADKFLPK